MTRTDILNKSLDSHSKDKMNPLVHEEIAKVYLKTSDEKKEQAKPERRLWPKRFFILLFILAALFILAFLLRSNIDIKIRIFTEVPGIRLKNAKTSFFNIADRGIFFVKGSVPNISMVKETSFLGDARSFSKRDANEIVLCNSRGSGWANYTIEFKEPMDLGRLNINYTAMGARGDEHLILVLVDAENRSYRMEKDLSSALTNEWRKYTISFRHLRNAIDLKNISIIRFEFGSLTAGNSPGATIFLKDIYITKDKRPKWL